jgi:hypothetical protein
MKFKLGDVVIDYRTNSEGVIIAPIYVDNTERIMGYGVRLYNYVYVTLDDYHFRYYHELSPSPIMDTPLFKVLRED